jgi:Tfp pilus assembly protein PilO
MKTLRNTGVTPQKWMVHAAGAAATLAFSALFVWGFYVPMRREAAELRQESERIRLLSTAGEKIAADHRRLTTRLVTLHEAVRRTRRRMPDKVAPATFVDQASRLARDFGLEVSQTQTGVPQHYATHSQVEVSYVLTGSFASVGRYFAAIDQTTPLTRVAQLDVNRSANSMGYPCQVTFQLYYQTDSNDKDEQRGTL